MAARKKRPRSRRYGSKYNVVFIPMRVAEFARDNQLPSPEKRNRGYLVKLDHFIVPARTSSSARKAREDYEKNNIRFLIKNYLHYKVSML